ncbi:hypothetical protein [Millionella massiliensis]|uniref:hypothetical protein n=1 Tax=Millionella massiliensis TaxID=1871023 RepID=UPI0023A7F24C|nr:hypothetical protein [Millionella massiliensis]
MARLVDSVRDDIRDFLEKNNELLFNERDLQMQLAIWLRRSAQGYEDVDLEYYVPRAELAEYVWESELRLDIVVRRGGEFLPVELKYKTRSITRRMERFGETLRTAAVVVKNQGAQDLGRYDFWKDVRRMELIRKRFAAVRNGLALFLTNDPTYLRAAKESSNHKALSMAEGIHDRKKEWQDKESACARGHPDFEVEFPYAIEWQTTRIDNESFHYCILQI